MRKNHPRSTRPAEHYETAVIDLPHSPHIRQLVSRNMKTVYRNLSAAPWASQSRVVETFDENFLPVFHDRP